MQVWSKIDTETPCLTWSANFVTQEPKSMPNSQKHFLIWSRQHQNIWIDSFVDPVCIVIHPANPSGADQALFAHTMMAPAPTCCDGNNIKFLGEPKVLTENHSNRVLLDPQGISSYSTCKAGAVGPTYVRLCKFCGSTMHTSWYLHLITNLDSTTRLVKKGYTLVRAKSSGDRTANIRTFEKTEGSDRKHPLTCSIQIPIEDSECSE